MGEAVKVVEGDMRGCCMENIILRFKKERVRLSTFTQSYKKKTIISDRSF